MDPQDIPLKNALIVWHHEGMSELLSELLQTSLTFTWPADNYDGMIHLNTRTKNSFLSKYFS